MRCSMLRFRAAAPLMASLLICFALAGCSGGGTPPVSDRSRIDNSTERRAARVASGSGSNHRVVAGDTLYSIAWRYQRDFRDLALLNGISAPFAIYPGQVLKLKGRPAQQQKQPHPLASTRTKPQSGPAINKGGGTTAPKATSASAVKSRTPKVPVALRSGPVQLRWPSSGKRVRAFGSVPAGGNKPGNNIDFALQPGAAIKAAGAGEVVFAQASLAGYRQFVILKHNDTWLSSYGFNAPLSVREGQIVAAGATLATLGRAVNGMPNERVLRFEVRKDGAAVNPESVIGP